MDNPIFNMHAWRRPFLSRRIGLAAMLLLLIFPWAGSSAQPMKLDGQWFNAANEWVYNGQSRLNNAGLTPIAKPNLTGGRFFYQADFDVKNNEPLVLDFKNVSVIGQFHHWVFDAQGHLTAEAEGGIQSREINPFFLRHGREFKLAPGRYRLITELSSPFLIAQPQPYIDTLDHYQQAINSGNALTFFCLGILLSLTIYYGILSLTRRNIVDGLYALFILGNIVFDAAALLVFADMFDWHWFYIIGLPFLVFCNWVYVSFVIRLLNITREKNPVLHGIGMALLGLYAVFVLLAIFKSNWSMELERYAVGLYLVYGLVCGIVRARQGHPSAPMYLIAIGAFFLLGGVTISISSMEGIYTIYVEHLGLLSITTEAILLSFVLAQQFSQMNREKEQALSLAQSNLHVASTDALTGLPNRYALEAELQKLPAQGSLTFIDLDGLKYYNDRFGHKRGDDLLREFGRLLQQRLPEQVKLHRLGGDEFAITHPQGNMQEIERIMCSTIEELRCAGFELAGASFGSVHVHENPLKESLMHMADERMYQNKNSQRINPQPEAV